MELKTKYDVAIVGGGLAGLSSAIELRRSGHEVIVFEKSSYPFHKVCGEYISMESWNFLEHLGIPLGRMSLPRIHTLLLTAPNGNSFTSQLPLGGFGISRFALDHQLANQAKNMGVHIAEHSKVDEITFHDEKFIIHSKSNQFIADACCAAFGKHSNLDVKWKRQYLLSYDKRLDNFVAIKYHIKTDWPHHMIGLHNFENGYCGISKIEDDLYCLCYMTRASELKKCNHQVHTLEEKILYSNPHLKKIFLNCSIAAEFPVSISQINFNRKTQVEDHVLMLGDAAGLIAPLCGNGMSMALHSGKIAASLVDSFLKGMIGRKEMEENYSKEWKHHFAGRLRTGRVLQGFFGKSSLSNLFVKTFRTFPFLAGPIVKMTHGKPY